MYQDCGISQVTQNVLRSAKLKINKNKFPLLSYKEIAANARTRLNSDFFQMIDDTFERKEQQGFEPVVYLDEIRNFYKKTLSKLNIIVNKKSSSDLAAQYGSSNGVTTVKGFELNYKIKDNKDFIKKGDAETLSDIAHENTHLNLYLTEPKFTRRYLNTNLDQIIDEIQYNFYDSLIYNNELENLAPDVQKKFLENPKLRIENVENKTNAFFEKFSISSEDKIEILQAWRHGLKSELAAYRSDIEAETNYAYPLRELTANLENNNQFVIGDIDSEFYYDSKKFQSLDDKITSLKAFISNRIEKTFAKATEQIFFFPEKIEIIEKMLSAEIAKVRLQNKVINENKDLLK